jgi:hypothetical protein
MDVSGVYWARNKILYMGLPIALSVWHHVSCNQWLWFLMPIECEVKCTILSLIPTSQKKKVFVNLCYLCVKWRLGNVLIPSSVLRETFKANSESTTAKIYTLGTNFEREKPLLWCKSCSSLLPSKYAILTHWSICLFVFGTNTLVIFMTINIWKCVLRIQRPDCSLLIRM